MTFVMYCIFPRLKQQVLCMYQNQICVVLCDCLRNVAGNQIERSLSISSQISRSDVSESDVNPGGRCNNR